ncbi:hypothetical protein BDN72DRAFT_122178 [Pluteus cervinus]|uniref:Uncharacterized protein n=1 Tax=Pluteus cervinus TaxID=181527 RepID=A0ACD3B6V5_9AGAR|nr:hypothetical protein BDN72DRAFT_122178 [Pluteus cervinus]
MSLTGEQEILKPILLRSTTPGPTDKVLRYLEGMSKEGPDDAPPRSMVDPDEFKSRGGSALSGPMSPRMQASNSKSRNGQSALSRQIEGPIPEGGSDDDDGDSNIQVGRRSEDGRQVPQGAGEAAKYRPKYESYDSVQTWGNRGPLPEEFAQGAWSKSPAVPQWNTNMGPSGSNGQSKAPLPASDFGASPRPSNKPPTVISESRRTPPEEPTSPKSSRSQINDKRPLSPLSVQSRVTEKSRAVTDNVAPYPPLPESQLGGFEDGFMSPRAKSHRSKAPSISPSDSPSQVKPKRNKTSDSHNAGRSGSALSGTGHQNRPFSPYRHAPTTADLVHAAARGRALIIPEEEEEKLDEPQSELAKAPSVALSQPKSTVSKVPSLASSSSKALSASPSKRSQAQSHSHSHSALHTPPRSHASQASETEHTPRPPSPLDLNDEEARIVNEALAAHTPRTSYYAASALDPVATNSYHDQELCVLLQQEGNPNAHDVVKKVLRKAIKSRIKHLGMRYDNESIKQFKQAHHNHDPSVHAPVYYGDEPPKWAEDLKRELVVMQQRIESLGPKIENLRSPISPGRHSMDGDGSNHEDYEFEGDEYPQSTVTQTVNIHTQPAGTVDSQYHPAGTEVIDEEEGYDEMEEEHMPHVESNGETPTQSRGNYAMSDHDDSPGHQFLQEELFKLKKREPTQPNMPTHWDVTRDGEDSEPEHDAHTNGGVPTIPDEGNTNYQERGSSPPLPALPTEAHELVQHHWPPNEPANEPLELRAWQKIHQRLLNWAMVWPMNEVERAVNSTTRGRQIDEVALSIWTTQTYKRLVRAMQSDNPPAVVDRMFVPPNMAETINNAVFNGRHQDACTILRDLWNGFSLQGMPRLMIVLAKHRNNDNHWVVHRYSLPDGSLTTYDCCPDRTLHDGRPLGWWFAIRLAWPNAIYPSPDHLVQKMVRLHRPLQAPIDNSVAAAGIFRNVLLGSRAERSLDLERLRDLINTEVRNIRQRKTMGKMTISLPRTPWLDMN